MEEVFELVKRVPQGQCQNRTVEQIAVMTSPQQFISTAPDVCVSAYRRFRWTESVNRRTHDECFHDDDEVGVDKKPTDRDEKGRHIHARKVTRIRVVRA